MSTSKLRAEVELRAWDGEAAALGISLKSRRPWRKWVFLEEDDEVIAEYNGQSIEMLEEVVGKKHTYVAWFGDLEAGEEVSVGVFRADDEDAPRSTARLPEPFELVPSTNAIELGWEGVDLNWFPSGSADEMEIEINGSCISRVRRSTEDDGFYSLSAGDFRALDDEDPESCVATIEVRRVIEGELDPALKGGECRGVQIRTANVSLFAFGSFF